MDAIDENRPPTKRRGRPPKPRAAVEKSAPATIEGAIQAQQEESKKAVQEVARSFAQLLLIGTVLAGLLAQQEHLAMTKQEANAIATPLASIFSKTSLFRKYGRNLSESHDYIALSWALYQYTARVIEGWQKESPYGQETSYTPRDIPKAAANGTAAEPLGNPSRSIQTNPFATSPKSGTGVPFFGRPD